MILFYICQLVYHHPVIFGRSLNARAAGKRHEAGDRPDWHRIKIEFQFLIYGTSPLPNVPMYRGTHALDTDQTNRF
jgi:hypothetical protein